MNIQRTIFNYYQTIEKNEEISEIQKEILFTEIEKYFPNSSKKMEKWDSYSKEERLELLDFFIGSARANKQSDAPAPSPHHPVSSNHSQTIKIENNINIQISAEHKLILKKLSEEYEEHKDDPKKLTEILADYAPVVMKIIAGLSV